MLWKGYNTKYTLKAIFIVCRIFLWIGLGSFSVRSSLISPYITVIQSLFMLEKAVVSPTESCLHYPGNKGSATMSGRIDTPQTDDHWGS
jgi:hypothetical protein